MSQFNDNCCICLQSLEERSLGRQTLPCGHIMHEACILEMRKKGASGRCPLCLQKHEDLTPIQILLDRAALRHFQKKYTESAKLYAEVLDIDPLNEVATVNLGCAYLAGEGRQLDVESAEKLFEKLRGVGNVHAITNLGKLNAERGQVQKAINLWEEARRLGGTEATVNLAMVYHYGDAGPPDIHRAMSLYKEGHQRGSSLAARILGTLHKEQGEFRKAVALFATACKEDAEANVHLGHAYHHGEGVDCDPQRAKAFYERAHLLGSPNGAWYLAHWYAKQFHESAGDCQYRLVSSEPLEKAIHLYQEAHNRGIPEAAEQVRNLSVVLGKPCAPEETIASTEHLSALEAGPSQSIDRVNAQISAALIEGERAIPGPQVCLLKYSRRPAELRTILASSSVLKACGEALEAHGFTVELPSGAKVFVRLEHYEPTCAALKLNKWKLHADCVVVDLDLKAVVVDLVKKIAPKTNVYPKVDVPVPLGVAKVALSTDLNITYTQTFISIRVPSSLRSDSGTSEQALPRSYP